MTAIKNRAPNAALPSAGEALGEVAFEWDSGVDGPGWDRGALGAAGGTVVCGELAGTLRSDRTTSSSIWSVAGGVPGTQVWFLPWLQAPVCSPTVQAVPAAS